MSSMAGFILRYWQQHSIFHKNWSDVYAIITRDWFYSWWAPWNAHPLSINCAKKSTRRKLGTSCCSVLEGNQTLIEKVLSLSSATNFSIATFPLVPLLTIRVQFLLNNATLKSAALTSQENSKYPRTSETTPHSRISISGTWMSAEYMKCHGGFQGCLLTGDLFSFVFFNRSQTELV
jgi:hypothetical protein